MSESARKNDPLVNCLVFIAKLKGLSIASDTIRSSVPYTGGVFTASQFMKAAESVGLSTSFMKRSLDTISKLTLPAVLLLKDNNACVLVDIDEKKGVARIVFSETQDGAETISLEQLEKDYLGHVIFVKEKFSFDRRPDEAPLITKSKSWFWDTFWHFKELYTRVILASIFINLFVLTVPLFIMNVYDRVVPNQAIETLWALVIGVFIVLAFDLILKVLRAYFVDVAGKKADIIISSSLLSHSLNTVMEEQPSSVGVRANYLKEFEFIREFFSSATIATFIDLPFVFLFIFVIQIIGGPLFIVPVIAVLLVIINAAILSRFMFDNVQESFIGGTQKNALLVESLSGIEDIKAHSAQASIIGRWQKYASLTASALSKVRFFSNLAITTATFAISFSSIAVVVWGVYLIGQESLTIGALIACTILTGRALSPLVQITALLTRWHQARCSMNALDSIMQAAIEKPPGKQYLSKEDFQGDIKLEHITFRHHEQKFELFKDLNLQINAREKVAVIGSLGSGKSTLLKLIDGLYSPLEGVVRVDGIDIRQIDPIQLRQNIGFLAQEPKLFFGTAYTNISFKAPWKESSAVIKAAKLSGADAFLSRHPEGYQMPIGEGGKGLSGGQVQTVALARALFSDPKLLLLDEPTSQMDHETEQHFIRMISEYAKDKTVLIVTHKKSLLHIVDRIIILQQGVIVMDGPKEQIMQSMDETMQKKKK